MHFLSMTKHLKFLATILLIFLYFFTKAQIKYDIPLTASTIPGSLGLKFFLKAFDPVDLKKHVTLKNGMLSTVKEFYFQPWFYYYKLLQNDKNAQTFKENATQYEAFDSAQTKKLKIKTGYKIVISKKIEAYKANMSVDENQNGFFTDEKSYSKTFDDRTLFSFDPLYIKGAEIFDGKHVIKRDFVIYPGFGIQKMYDRLGNLRFDTTVIVMAKSPSRYGNLKIDNQNYTFCVQIQNPRKYYYYTPKTTVIWIAKEGEQYLWAGFHYMKDTIYLGGKSFTFSSIDLAGTKLVIQQVEDSLAQRYDVTDTMYNFHSNDIVTGVPFSLKSGNGKYTLLDFWGTWCAPCIAALPHLVETVSGIDTSKVQVVSICYDDLKNIPLAKEIITKNGATWVQLYQDKGDETAENIIKAFNVFSFPSFYLLAPDGAILNKEFDNTYIEKLEPLLKKYKLVKEKIP